ncbi:MAG: UvrD-helicase domain-containing protein, partial [bacterium]
MIVFQNRAIRASAGTGKTFRLAHRYIGLMATGVQPERICALTFSRKAAGEIFDKIVEHLCGAATDEKKRARTAGAILKEKLCVPQDTPESYRNLLRELLNQGHRLRIGTLDSFILGIVRAFPMELGIPPETQPVNGDGGEALAMRLSILTRLFDPSRANGPDGRNEGDMFLRDFRQACFGQVTKSLVARLDRLISDFYGFYRQHSKADCHWGVIDRIWEPAERWWEDPELRSVVIPADLPVRLAGAFGAADSKGNLGKACAAIAAAAMAHSADRSWPDLNETILSRLLQYAAQSSPPAINYSRKDYSVPAVLWPPLRRALGNLIGVEVARALERTKGQRAVLDRYDRLYSGALGTDGRFTFEDLSRILGADGLRPSRKQSESNRLFIDYRLDGMLDHWLLDEFQDTSNTQWSALGNLIDEVIQGSGRSFFYVGDVKQSIYGWRGGNHRLFGAVLENYKNADERAITTESINACHRSLPAIIDTVNMVFENLAGWEPDIAGDQRLRKDAIDAFSGAWEKHVSARLGEGEGFASLLEYEPKKKTAKPDGAGEGDGGEEEYSDDPAQFEAVAEVLKQVQPTKRSITVAVLVGTNEDGRACVDVLRRQLSEVPVVHEGTGGIVDNPVVCLLLALVR